MSLPTHVFSYLTRRKTKHLILHITNRCNLRCSHCFVDKESGIGLPLEKTREIANQLGSIQWLDIGGGEPYLVKDIADHIAAFDCEMVGLPTNGFCTDLIAKRTPMILDTMTARDIAVSVSIEGFRKHHAALRGNADSYDRAWESLAILKRIADEDSRLRVKVNTVITEENFDSLIPFMEHVQQSGLVDFHSVILLRGEPDNTDIRLPSLDALEAKRHEIFSILDRYHWGNRALSRHVLRNYYHVLWDVSLANLREKRQTIPCLAGQVHLVIWANGDVATCELLPPVGNVFEDDLLTVLGGDRLRERLARIKGGECVCTHNCAMLDSIFFNPRLYPRLLCRV